MTLPHAAKELQWLRRHGSSVLHGRRPRAKEALSLKQGRWQALDVIKQDRILHLILLLEMELELDLLNLIRVQLNEPDR